jgi:hydrogenase expression/formation protein HypE
MSKTVIMAHGSGSKLSHDLIEKNLLQPLHNDLLAKLDDSSVFDIRGRLAFTTDSYVVSPIFFPGGDIGKLAVCGTVNDLSMSGASPLYLSLAFIIEEGLPLDALDKIVNSIKLAAGEAGVQIITGDTKVVDRGSADKIFINTAGIGIIADGIDISGSNAKAGDKIILSGSIGDHGIAILSKRQGFDFKVPVESDCAPLNSMVADMLEASPKIHVLRDPTRGGLATTLNEIASQSGVEIVINEDRIPVHDGVRGACELLGFDPLYIANEGKLVAFVPAGDAEKVLSKMQQHGYGKEACIIGEVTETNKSRVILKTRLGASRIVDMLTGELLPRIC